MPRTIAGRLRGRIEPGTIVGPNYNGEYLVALEPEVIDLGNGASMAAGGAMFYAPLNTDEPGTVTVEPNTWQRITPEYTEFGYATTHHLDAARQRDEPWSVAEAKLRPARGASR